MEDMINFNIPQVPVYYNKEVTRIDDSESSDSSSDSDMESFLDSKYWSHIHTLVIVILLGIILYYTYKTHIKIIGILEEL